MSPRKRSPEYQAWKNMKQRCLNPKHPQYKHYGARGISVCARWMSFESFLKDVGPRPSADLSLDRYPNNDGNYEPGNVRWATMSEQAFNRRPRASQLPMAHVIKAALELAEGRGGAPVCASTIASRLRSGWTVEQAISLPKSATIRPHGGGVPRSRRKEAA